VNSGNNVQTGEKCPKCGAEGKAYHGEHETAVRNVKLPRPTIFGSTTVVDVGWRCWNCGHEWGFELVKEEYKEHR